ncbi:MAG: serine/threonine protein kinase [Phycisphaeraceae bacterium]|nr:serine/threonine protein kinase [Phycisphaeraceae bacterium]
MSRIEDTALLDLVRAAVALPPSERAAFIARRCPSDRRADFDRLMRSQEEATVDRPSAASEGIAASEPGRRPVHPERIGSYAIVDVLGEGGMGVVYLARQERPDRLIALKVVRPGLLTPRMLRRFEHEAQILGLLQHPGIAQIYEAGTADTGLGLQPFFAMEHVDGVPLGDHVRQADLGVRDRIRLMIKVCDAVHHAHQKGIIHRDLKPSNILIARRGADAVGEPKVLDFGIARADSDNPSATLQTEAGQLVGTVPYMSPEQVAGDPNDLDTRSDVYALGVILYELLAGRLPHAIADRTFPEAVRIIGQDEPVLLGSCDRGLRGDLQTICSKALERDRERRYQSATELAADLGRYLRHEPIVARPASAVYQFTKFARRNRGLVAAIAVAGVILIAGAVATAWQAAEAMRGWELAQRRENEATIAQRAAEEEAANAKAVNQFLTTMLTAADPEQDNERDMTVREMLDIAAESLKASAPARPRVRLSILGSIANTYKGVGQSAKAEPHARNAVDLARETYGPDHPETITAERMLALVLNDLARFDESEPLLIHAREATIERFGPDSAESAAVIGDLASLEYQRGNLKAAEPLLREAIRLGTAKGGRTDRDVLTNMDHLGSLLSMLGRFEEAEELLRRTLEIRSEVFGPEHPVTAFTMNSLANAVQKQGRGAEAIELIKKALEIRRQKLDPEHPSLIVTMQNLAVALVGEKRLDEAEPLLREAVRLQTRKLGPDHPKTLLMMGNLAYLLEDQGKLDKAEPLYRQVVEARRRADQMADPEAWPQINNLAMCLQALGKPAEAEPLYREALMLASHQLPADHYYLAIFRNNLGDCLTEMKRFEEAESELKASLPALEKFFGEAHPRTTKAISRLAKLYDAWDRPGLAEAMRDRTAKR